jgi:hypothetical protein
MYAAIRPMLVDIALADQEPQLTMFSHDAFGPFATTGGLHSTTGLGE